MQCNVEWWNTRIVSGFKFTSRKGKASFPEQEEVRNLLFIFSFFVIFWESWFWKFYLNQILYLKWSQIKLKIQKKIQT